MKEEVMKLGKSKMLLGLAIAGGVLYTSQDVAKADIVTDAIAAIVSKGVPQARPLFCRKGAGLGTISIRSASGSFCTDKRVAALALKLCEGWSEGTDSFNGSQCDQKARAALGLPASANPAADQAKVDAVIQADPALSKVQQAVTGGAKPVTGG
jgi:hypothetical protein